MSIRLKSARRAVGGFAACQTGRSRPAQPVLPKVRGGGLCLFLGLTAMLSGGPATGQKAPKPVKPPKPPRPVFLEVRQKQLYLGDVPFRNIGVNIPDLFERFLHGDDASGVKALADAKAAGVLFVRCWGTT